MVICFFRQEFLKYSGGLSANKYQIFFNAKFFLNSLTIPIGISFEKAADFTKIFLKVFDFYLYRCFMQYSLRRINVTKKIRNSELVQLRTYFGAKMLGISKILPTCFAFFQGKFEKIDCDGGALWCLYQPFTVLIIFIWQWKFS